MRSVLILLLIACFAPHSYAQATPQRTQKQADAQKQLGTVRAQIKALSDEQKRIDDARDAAAKQLREVDGKVAVSQRSLRATDARIAAQQAQLADLQAQQEQLEDRLGKQREELAELVRSAYTIGQHGQLQMLLEQGRMSDLARVLAYHKYFQQDRQKRITGLSAELQSLATVSEQVRQQQQALVAARAKQQSQLASLGTQKRERAGMVTTLEAKYRDRDQRLNALGRDEKNTVALLERLRKLMAQVPKPPPTVRTPGTKGSGVRPPVIAGNPNIPIGPLNLPLAGTVLAGYGGTMPDGHASKGLLIAGTAGAEVHAVSAGRVAYADWLKGYGLLIILDHGNGWMTLYAFNDALLKNTGDAVRAGEAISTVGSSGAQGKPALYFELRRNGLPQDPRAWLKK